MKWVDHDYHAHGNERDKALWHSLKGAMYKDPNTPLRMYIALRLLRAWNNGTEGFDGLVVKTVNDWIDHGMQGNIPWIRCPFFEEWAGKTGYSNCDGFVGFKVTGLTGPIQTSSPPHLL